MAQWCFAAWMALLISIYGAMRAASGIMGALNVIYEQPERGASSAPP